MPKVTDEEERDHALAVWRQRAMEAKSRLEAHTCLDPARVLAVLRQVDWPIDTECVVCGRISLQGHAFDCELAALKAECKRLSP